MAARSFGMILVMLGTAFAQTRSVGQQGCITDLGKLFARRRVALSSVI